MSQHPFSLDLFHDRKNAHKEFINPVTEKPYTLHDVLTDVTDYGKGAYEDGFITGLGFGAAEGFGSPISPKVY